MPSRSRRALLRASGSALAVAAAGCLGRSGGPTAISMTDELRFEPGTATVGVGGTVEWVNDGGLDHTVTARADGTPDGATYFASGEFDTERAARDGLRAGLIASGETYEHAFETPGTYEYYCIPHEGSGMVGTVRVG